MYMQSSLVSNVVSVTWGRVLGDWAVLGGGEKSDAFHSIYWNQEKWGPVLGISQLLFLEPEWALSQ